MITKIYFTAFSNTQSAFGDTGCRARSRFPATSSAPSTCPDTKKFPLKPDNDTQAEFPDHALLPLFVLHSRDLFKCNWINLSLQFKYNNLIWDFYLIFPSNWPVNKVLEVSQYIHVHGEFKGNLLQMTFLVSQPWPNLYTKTILSVWPTANISESLLNSKPEIFYTFRYSRCR